MILAYIWLGVAIVLGIFEAHTTQLVSVWFAIAAFISAILAIVGLPWWLQLAAFIVLSVALLIATKPLVRRFISSRPKAKLNLDRIIGQTALILSDVGNGIVGQAKVGGQVWSAVAAGNEVFPKDSHAEVVSIDGVKLVLKNIDC